VCVGHWYGWCLERPQNIEYTVEMYMNRHIYLTMAPCGRNTP
jgi:hypothetical protein